MEKYYFLQEDFEALNRTIRDLDKKIKDILQQAGDACKQGADTWHDNFEYEEIQRQAVMWSNRLKELVALRAKAQIITPCSSNEEVLIGKIVTIEDCDTKEKMRFQIGSYMTFKGNRETVESISYAAPLANILIGAKEGEIKEGVIGGKYKRFKILKIE